MLLFAFLAFVAAADQVRDQRDIGGHSSAFDSAQSRFKVPKLINFEQYKQLFNKVYSIQVENLTRAKLFIARSFRAFVSALSYKYKRSSSYLAINQMSDWLPEQVKRSILGRESLKGIEFIPLVDVDELIEERRTVQENNGLASKQDRRKRSTDFIAQQKQQDMQDLISFSEDEDRENSLAQSLIGNPFGSSLLNTLKQAKPRTTQPDKQTPDAMFTDNRRCFLPAKDQRDCGSCWIFSVMALYEWTYCSVFNQKIDLSEQYVIDCGQRMGYSGCTEGFFENTSAFVRKYGTELAARYPYTARNGECPYDSSISSDNMGLLRFSDTGFVSVKIDQVEKYLRLAPLIMVLFLNDKFHEYGGGVDDGAGCTIESVHAVLAVGSGREDGKDYWLIRNTFGTYWGTDGYYKLNKKNECVHSKLGYVLNNPTVPTTTNPQYMAEPIERKYASYLQANLDRSGILSPTIIRW